MALAVPRRLRHHLSKQRAEVGKGRGAIVSLPFLVYMIDHLRFSSSQGEGHAGTSRDSKHL